MISQKPFHLERFITAQALVYGDVKAELAQGRKRTHWIWFIFPQVEGLGHSAMAQRYAIRSRDEAVSYVEHPLLAARLLECTSLVLTHRARSAHEIFGSPDDLKFRSSMTLFNQIGGGDMVFRHALDKFYSGSSDPATLAALKSWGGDSDN